MYAYCLNDPLGYIDPYGYIRITISGTSVGVEISGSVSTKFGPVEGVDLNLVPDLVGGNIMIVKDLDEGEKTQKHGLVKAAGYVTDDSDKIAGVYVGLNLGVPGIEGMPLEEAIQKLGKAIEKLVEEIQDLINDDTINNTDTYK